jgi:hypothetical protein
MWLILKANKFYFSNIWKKHLSFVSAYYQNPAFLLPATFHPNWTAYIPHTTHTLDSAPMPLQTSLKHVVSPYSSFKGRQRSFLLWGTCPRLTYPRELVTSSIVLSLYLVLTTTVAFIMLHFTNLFVWLPITTNTAIFETLKSVVLRIVSVEELCG